jgi:hypothetical protein
MGQTDELNAPKPPKFLERVVNLAVPRASREHVLGDLHERYVSPLGYLKDAASAVPGAILGRIRRITPVPYLVLEFVLIYASILIAAFWTRGMGPVWGGGDFSKSALAAVYLLMVVTARDVYRGDPFSLTPEQLELASRLHFNREVLRRVSIVGDILCVTMLAFGAYYGAGLLFPSLSAFPPIMTTQYSTLLVTALLSPLRLWLGTRKHSPERRA